MKPFEQTVAFVFPGQGTQYIGMGKELYEQEESIKELFNLGSKQLHFDLAKLCFEGPEEDLLLTEYQQPAIHTVEIAILQKLTQLGIRPAMVAGYSLGEYAALVASGALRYEDTVTLVRKRGLLMQQAVPKGQGAMVAILGLKRDRVKAIVDKASQVGTVECSNFNGPTQVIVSGYKEAVAKADELAKQLGVRTVYLKVSGPFHTSLLIPAGDGLYEELKKIPISTPSLPFIPNVTGSLFEPNDDLATSLRNHVSRPVMWEETIVTMLHEGIRVFVEIGPTGSVTKFNKAIAESLGYHDVEFFHIENKEGLETFLHYYHLHQSK